MNCKKRTLEECLSSNTVKTQADKRIISSSFADCDGSDCLNGSIASSTTPIQAIGSSSTKFSSSVQRNEIEKMAMMTQSERKRYREKKRRSDITNAVDELTRILIKVDPNSLIRQNNQVFGFLNIDKAEVKSGSIPGSRISATSCSTAQLLNRTEIIAHACRVLERLHVENAEMKIQSATLTSLIQGNSNSLPSTNIGSTKSQMISQLHMLDPLNMINQSCLLPSGMALQPQPVPSLSNASVFEQLHLQQLLQQRQQQQQHQQHQHQLQQQSLFE